MDKSRTCFFTGHRKIASRIKDELKLKLSEHIEQLINENVVDTFIAGGALGFDTMAARAVIDLRVKYPHIKLVLYLPCYGQGRGWTDTQKYYYRMVLSEADDFQYVTEGEYTEDCMHLRNMAMVKDSSYCIAFCVMANSGTGKTLRSAEAVGIDIINLADEIYE